MAQARILTDKEYRKVLLHIAKKKHSSRNKSMLYMSHLGGLRAIEIASLTIKDVLADDGTIKDEFFLRARQTKGDRGRTVLVPQNFKTNCSTICQHASSSNVMICVSCTTQTRTKHCSTHRRTRSVDSVRTRLHSGLGRSIVSALLMAHQVTVVADTLRLS